MNRLIQTLQIDSIIIIIIITIIIISTIVIVFVVVVIVIIIVIMGWCLLFGHNILTSVSNVAILFDTNMKH